MSVVALMQSYLLCVDRQQLLWTSSFSEQLVRVTGGIFFLTVNTAKMTKKMILRNLFQNGTFTTMYETTWLIGGNIV